MKGQPFWTPELAKEKFKKQLFVFLALFVLGISALSYFTYKQLQTDALLKATESIDEIVLQMEEYVAAVIRREDRRSFYQYSHFNFPRGNQKKFYQQDNLGNYRRYHPAIKGYFQINPKGQFLSPVYVPREFSDARFSFKDAEVRKKKYEDLLHSLATISAEPRFENAGPPKILRKIRNSARKQLKFNDIEELLFSFSKKGPLFSKDKLEQVNGNTIFEQMKIKWKKNYQSIEPGKFYSHYTAGGDLVYYREVIKNNQRYLQGFLVDLEHMVTYLTKKIVEKRYISWYSAITYDLRGHTVASFFQTHDTPEYFIERPLSFLVPGLKMNIIINKIPRSSSEMLFYILILVISIILSISFLGLYKTGLSQIKLASERMNFVSSVSHELRTPLTSISMYSEMLRSNFIVDPNKQRKYYDFIFNESERLSRLINNILKLSKVATPKDKLAIEKHNSIELIELISKKVDAQVKISEFELEVKKDVNFDIDLDEDSFIQIFINLIDNSLKFAKESENKTIQIGVKIENNKKIFFVRDFGPGIPKSEHDKIFQLFYRGEDELTRKSSGTGIGLALVQSLAHQIGAKVTLVNRSPGLETQIIFNAKS